MSELKPCPFCGGAPLLIEGPYDYDGGDRWYYYSATFECTCGLTLEVMNTFPKVFHSSESALDFAIVAWNTRTERTTPMYRDNHGIWHCENCEHGADRLTGSNGALDAWEDSWAPNYCPNCGAKVVEHD